MTPAAWFLMLATWAVVAGFTGYFFYRVLTTPSNKD